MSLSSEIITETETVLFEREHLRERYPYTNEDVIEFCQFLQRAFALVTELPPLTGIVRDPNDDMVVACALAASADYIVTRDKDLLSLEKYEGITMIAPEDFLHVLRGEPQPPDR